MKKNIKIYSRFLSLQNQGAGRVTLDLYEGLKKEYNVNFNGLKDNRKSNLWYLYQLTIGKLFNFKKSDINIAATSMDTFWLNPKKSIVIVHDLIPLVSQFEIKTHYNTSFITKFGSLFLFYFTLKKAIKFKKIICISSKTKKELINAFPQVDQNKIIVINNGVQDKYTPQKRTNNKKFVLYTVSVLDNRKRTLELIDWFNNSKLKDVELRIGGKGSLFDEAVERSKNNPNIKLLGFIPEKDMVKRYAECDAFIFPTLEEGFGMPIVEAASCFRPVITLKDSKIPEEVKYLTIQSDWEELNNVVETLKKSDEWALLTNISYHRSKKFRYDYVEKIKNVIKDI